MVFERAASQTRTENLGLTRELHGSPDNFEWTVVSAIV